MKNTKIDLKTIMILSAILLLFILTIVNLGNSDQEAINPKFLKTEENTTITNYTEEPLNNLTREEEALLQTQGDKNFVETTQKVENKYPWYKKFPIVTEDYTIVYDYEKESFRIRFKVEITEIVKDKAIKAIQETTNLENPSYYIL